jgi:opacity protein-like surface antigen
MRLLASALLAMGCLCGCGASFLAGVGLSTVTPNDSALDGRLQPDVFVRATGGPLSLEGMLAWREYGYAYDEGAVEHTGDLTLFPFSLTLRWGLTPSPATLFVGAGAIWYLGASEDISGVTDIDAAGAYRLAIGIDLSLGERLALGAELQYDFDVDDVDVTFASGGETRIDTDSVVVRVSAGYRF